MKKLLSALFLLLFALNGQSQIKIAALPNTTGGTASDLIIKNDSANGPTATKNMKISDLFLHYGYLIGGAGYIHKSDTARHGGANYITWFGMDSTIAHDTNNALNYICSVLYMKSWLSVHSNPSGYAFYKGTTDTAWSTMNSLVYVVYDHAGKVILTINNNEFQANVGNTFLTLLGNSQWEIGNPSFNNYIIRTNTKGIQISDSLSIVSASGDSTSFMSGGNGGFYANNNLKLGAYQIYFNRDKWPTTGTGYLHNDGAGNLTYASTTGPTGATGVTGPTGSSGATGPTGNANVSGSSGQTAIIGSASAINGYANNTYSDGVYQQLNFTSGTGTRGLDIFQSSSDAHGPKILMKKQRGTLSSPITVLAGDTSFHISGASYTGASYYNDSRIIGVVNKAVSAGTGSYMDFYTSSVLGSSVRFLRADSAQYLTFAHKIYANYLNIGDSTTIHPVANGGTGIATTTAYGLITGGTTATGNFQNAGTGSSGQYYKSGGSSALGTWTTISTLPTLTAGQILYGGKSTDIGQSSNFVWDTVNNVLDIGGATSTANTPLNVLQSNNGEIDMAFKNSSAGGSAVAAVEAINNLNHYSRIQMQGGSFTTSPNAIADMGIWNNTGANGCAIFSNGVFKLCINNSSTTANVFAMNSTGELAAGPTALPSSSIIFKLMAGTTTVAPFGFTSATPTSTPVTGTEEYDGNSMWFTPIGTTRYSFPMTAYTTTASASDSNTTAETSILSSTGIGSLTIPANGLVVGRMITIDVSGYYTSGVAKTITIKVKLGSTVVCTTGSVSQPTSQTQQYFRIRCNITCRTTGSSGTVQGGGDFSQFGSLTDNGIANVSATTINTTTSQAITVTATQGAASTDVIVGQQGLITINN